MSTTSKSKTSNRVDYAFRGLQYALELFATFLYRKMLERNTLQPIRNIMEAESKDMQRTLLRKWAQVKANECSYIQLAGGFLFTTVASCLQWPATESGHWSASALFYASILLSLIAVVMGSQQLLLLPNERKQASSVRTMTSSILPQTNLVQPLSKSDHELDIREIEDLNRMLVRIRTSYRSGQPNNLHVFALQAPIMMLSLSVVAFFGGLCSVVFAPLAIHLAWNNDAKIAVIFGSVALFATVVFFPTSLLMHGLFSVDRDETSKLPLYLAEIRA